MHVNEGTAASYTVSPGSLRNQLHTLFANQTGHQVLVAFHQDSHETYLNLNTEGSVLESDGCEVVSPGCCAKLFTSSLIRHASQIRKLDLSDTVEDWLATRSRGGDDALRKRITIRDLLEHSHGIDESDIGAPIHRSNRTLDVTEFRARASQFRPLFDPG